MNVRQLHEALRFEDDWTLAEDGHRPEHFSYLETIFAQANGYLGMRGNFEEGAPPDADSEAYFVCQGVFDQQPGRHETDELVNLPDPLPIQLEIGGIRVGAEEASTDYCERRLRLSDGSLTRELTVRLPGGDVTIVLRRWLSQANRHLMVSQITLTADEPVSDVRLRWGITTDRTNRGTVHFEETARDTAPAMVVHEIRTLESEITVAQAQACRLRINGEHAVPDQERQVSERDFLGMRWAFDLGAGEEVVVERINALCTSRDRTEGAPRDRATAHAFDAAEAGYDLLARENEAAWKRKWAGADVRIGGDNTADRALRYCLFQLMQANLDDDERTAIGAKTLSGPGYRGHFFWDTEMFMVPFFAHAHPPAARNLMAFRHLILPGARDLAREMGYAGARWPWEATRDGREQCPRWLPDNGGEVRIVTGEQEDHISSAVAWGAWYYYQVAGDEQFWRRQGLELLIEAARFWHTRVEWVDENERFEILRAMGPDENHELVDNNAYTNFMAAWTLRTAVKAVEHAGADERKVERLREIGLRSEEPEQWLNTAERLYLPLEEETGVIPQHDGFLEAARNDELEESIKQADVLMLLRIFPDLLPPTAQRSNWELYEPLTEHGSSLSPGVHAQISLRLGIGDEAKRYLRDALMVDLADTHENTAEGLHAAALGGAWMAVVQGVGGFWIDSEGRIHLDPSLPEEWESLSFSLRLRGGVLHFALGRQELTLTYRHPRHEALDIILAGNPIRVRSGRRLHLPSPDPVAPEDA